ncbi:MAG: DUF494 family protein [Candidatus Kapaibacteriota bacterium]
MPVILKDEVLIMYDRIMQIISEVIGRMQEGDKLTVLQFKELENRGFTVAEISTALSWIAERIEQSMLEKTNHAMRSNHAYRILNENERSLFSAEAWGTLIHFREIGLLQTEHVESIIERASMMNIGSMDTSTLTMLVVSLLFQDEDSKHSLHRILLKGDEEIH